MTTFRASERLEALPPYIFAEINAIKNKVLESGMDLISMAIGDPDTPTPDALVEKMKEAISRPKNHVYSPYEGSDLYRNAVKDWFNRRYGVELDASKEICALIGSKEGVAHFPQAICNTGDKALYPSPGFPVFETSLTIAGCQPIPIPMKAENNFLPDPNALESLMKEHKPKYMILNYPSNPTSACISKSELADIVTLAKKYNTIIGYDNAYAELYYDDNDKPISILEIPGAKDIAIEFQSLSKSFNMTGWRIAYAVGNPDLIGALKKIKTNIDSGPLLSVQEVAAEALGPKLSEEIPSNLRNLYKERRDVVLKTFDELSIEYIYPKGTFFIWAKVPGNLDSMAFTKGLIEQEGLVVTPGIGFGKEGEGFFRLALTVDVPRTEQAMDRLKKYLKK